MKNFFYFLILLLLIFLLREIDVANKKSITYDETVHTSAGYFYVKKGDFFINFEHPPFSKTLSGIFISPIKIMFPEQLYQTLRAYEWDLGMAFFYINRDKVDKIIFWARFPVILMGILLGFFIYLWSKNLYGEKAGIFSLFLFSFCPNFLAHGCLVTTDIPFTLFFIMTLYFLYKFFETNIKKFIIFSGISLGLALSTKFSGIILIPLILLILIVLEIRDDFKTKFKSLFPLFIFSLILLPFFIVLLIYRFYGFNNFILGIKGTLFETTERGHLSYLNGRFSTKGWRYYFLLAFLYKTPFSLIMLTLLAFFISLKFDKKEKFLLFPALIYFVFSSLSKKQIGIRYILPVYALLYIFSARLFVYHNRIKLNLNLKKIMFSFFIFWYAFVSLKIHPHYLAYFNQFAGGPDNGWKHLIDSNIDWGQDLKGLREYLKKEGNPELMLNYFGSVLPETYGLLYEPFLYPFFILSIPEEKYRLNSIAPRKEYLAISVNYLCGFSYKDIEIFKWLKEKKPKAKIGYSIYVYDITKDIYLRKKIAETLEKYGFRRQAERQRKILEKLE